MKKYIIGTIFGFVLATAVGANAQEVNKVIDSVVQGVFPVTVEGNSVGDAIVVNDKTYLPVREFGEAVGYKVTFTEDREVVLTKNGEIDTSQPTKPTTVKSVQDQIKELQAKLADEEKSLVQNKELLKVNEYLLKDPKVPKESAQKFVDGSKEIIIEIESRITEYESQLAALQAQQ
jgi:hypothetical protein